MVGKYGIAFGMTVLATDPKVINYENGIKPVSKNELIKKSDIISVHAEQNESTIDLINDNDINKMKKGVYLINTSRGEIVNENALIRGLEKKNNQRSGYRCNKR